MISYNMLCSSFCQDAFPQKILPGLGDVLHRICCAGQPSYTVQQLRRDTNGPVSELQPLLGEMGSWPLRSRQMPLSTLQRAQSDPQGPAQRCWLRCWHRCNTQLAENDLIRKGLTSNTGSRWLSSTPLTTASHRTSRMPNITQMRVKRRMRYVASKINPFSLSAPHTHTATLECMIFYR